MNRLPNEPDPIDAPDRAADPTFDLRQGLKVLVIVITVMVIVTIVCVSLAR